MRTHAGAVATQSTPACAAGSHREEEAHPMRSLAPMLVLALAGAAHAQHTTMTAEERASYMLDPATYTIDTQEIRPDAALDPGEISSRENPAFYSHIDPDYVTNTPSGTGFRGFDDYVASSPNKNFNLTQFQFVAGINAGPGIVHVDFLDTNLNLVDSFGFQLFTPGKSTANLFSITLDTPINIPGRGIVEITFDDGAMGSVPTEGEWFLSSSPTEIGSDSRFFGSVTDGRLQHSFALLPAPGAGALLALGGLTLARRRR